MPADLLDQLLAGGDAAAPLQQGGVLDSPKKALAERAFNAEMYHHLGHGDQVGNNRNGYGRKMVVTDTGKIEIEVPRDRQGSFDPQLIANYQRLFPGFDDKIVLAQGGTTTDACRRIAVTEQTYYRWRKEYGGLKIDQARRMKDLEKEKAARGNF